MEELVKSVSEKRVLVIEIGVKELEGEDVLWTCCIKGIGEKVV